MPEDRSGVDESVWRLYSRQGLPALRHGGGRGGGVRGEPILDAVSCGSLLVQPNRLAAGMG